MTQERKAAIGNLLNWLVPVMVSILMGGSAFLWNYSHGVDVDLQGHKGNAEVHRTRPEQESRDKADAEFRQEMRDGLRRIEWRLNRRNDK